MRDLLFLVADSNMRHAISGFMQRDAVHKIIGCRPLIFDWRTDIRVAKGQNDPGLFTRANEILKLYRGEYTHVVLIVDEEWDGSPGTQFIREKLEQHLNDAGWTPPSGLALVLKPEVDIWLWSDSPHSPIEMGWQSWEVLRPALESRGWLQPGASKPSQPKEAAEWALKNGVGNIRRSSAIYERITKKTSITRCRDDSVVLLLDALRTWFPKENP